jgi:hypothetical protein
MAPRTGDNTKMYRTHPLTSTCIGLGLRRLYLYCNIYIDSTHAQVITITNHPIYITDSNGDWLRMSMA